MSDPLASVRRPGEGLVVLFRHGRTAWNVEGRFLGRSDIPLDDEGRRQARGLAILAGRFERVYTSPLSRARDTAAALAPPEAVPVPELVEADQGELEGWRAAEALPVWPDFFAAFAADAGAARIPGGETLHEVRDRMSATLQRWRDAHPGAVIGAVSHQLAIAALVSGVAGEPVSAWRAFRLDHGEAFALRPTTAGWEVAGRLRPCEIPP